MYWDHWDPQIFYCMHMNLSKSAPIGQIAQVNSIIILRMANCKQNNIVDSTLYWRLNLSFTMAALKWAALLPNFYISPHSLPPLRAPAPFTIHIHHFFILRQDFSIVGGLYTSWWGKQSQNFSISSGFSVIIVTINHSSKVYRLVAI